MSTLAANDFTHIGKSVTINGEISGGEDVYVDGQLEGRIELTGNGLTVGPNARVHANIVAKSVTVAGTLDGNIQATERTEMRKTAVVNGDVQTRRIAIEEGAYFKGRLEILSEGKTQAALGD
jgi:cytoskeletal protein CcmA (bactofilin family)